MNQASGDPAKAKRRFRFRLFVREEYRPLRDAPWWLWTLAALALAAQIYFHARLQEAPEAQEASLRLSEPPSEASLRLAALAEPEALARALMLNLQAFDNQQGQSIPFAKMDYDVLGRWLDRIVALDERAAYPHFSAAKIYASVADESRQRKMVEWVRHHFPAAPAARWQWMAHATNVARYDIEDFELSKAMARELREGTAPDEAPGWARQMEVFFLENEGAYESSATLLSNLLEAGEVSSPTEFAFLLGRLEDIVKSMAESGQIKDRNELQQIQTRMDSLRELYLSQHAAEETNRAP